MFDGRIAHLARTALISILVAALLLWIGSGGLASPAATAQEAESPTDLILTLAPPIILADGRAWIRSLPHITAYPGVLIFLTVLAFNMFGDGVRDALDPRQKE